MMKFNALWLATLLLSACAQLPKGEAHEPPMPAKPALAALTPAERLAQWLLARQILSALGAGELSLELERLRVQHELRRDLDSAMSYALAASLPASPPAQQRRALDSLARWFDADQAVAMAEEERALAQWLQSLLQENQERRRCMEAQQQLQHKLREEQRLRLEAEQELARTARKLKALINIERRLLRRDPATPQSSTAAAKEGQ